MLRKIQTTNCRRRFVIIFLFMLIFCAGASVQKAQESDEWSKLSPFTKIVCETNRVMVRFQDHEYELMSINDVPVQHILDYCRREYRDQWDKRFAEDLVEVLEGMRHPMATDKTVKLTLKDVENNRLITVPRAPMTKENRNQVYSSTGFYGRLNPLIALDHFARTLEEQWSYYEAPGNDDIKSAIHNLREKLPTGLDSNAFALELEKIIALGIDGHARVERYQLPGGCLPFLIEPVRDRFIAFAPNRSGYLDADYPYVTRLDGRNLSEWLQAASVLVSRGSAQYIRYHSLKMLHNIEFIRQEMGIPTGNDLRVELQSEDRSSSKEIRLKIVNRHVNGDIWPRNSSCVLEDNIGYLRLTRMNGQAIDDITHWMPQFRETRGLVIDVRDNGGGSRAPLILLYSYLSSPAAPPKVANAGVYRLADKFGKDHLKHRFMYPENASVWSDAEREVISSFKQEFQPQWQPPAEKFSEWHYLVLIRSDHPDIFYYDEPVVVLMNEKCFSATDIFLAGLRGLSTVTLIGQPSGGGSAFTQNVELNESRIQVRLGSMVSFQTNGQLFDGNGVSPDIMIEPNPEYFIGGRDNVLEKAIDFILSKTQ